MKYMLILSLLISISSYGQKKTGFGQVAASAFINEKYENKFGISAAGGVGVGDLSSIGAGADFYVFSTPSSSNFAQIYGDFRFFFSGLSKEASPYIAFQPGAVLYNKKIATITTKGSFAINGLAGFFIRGKGIGGTMAIGVSHITFKSQSNLKTNYTGLKINVGLFL